MKEAALQVAGSGTSQGECNCILVNHFGSIAPKHHLCHCKGELLDESPVEVVLNNMATPSAFIPAPAPLQLCSTDMYISPPLK